MKNIIPKFIRRFSEYVYIFAPGLYKIPKKIKIFFSLIIIVPFLVLFSRGLCSLSTDVSAKKFGFRPLTVTDSNDDTWRLELLRGQPWSILKNNEQKPGPPLIVTTSMFKKGENLLIGVAIKGQANEKYIGGVKKNGQLQPAPKIKILDQAGKVICSGQFEYG